MKPRPIKGATRVMGKNQDEYLDLPIRDEKIDGLETMTSLWEPGVYERYAIAKGASIKLTILGTVHPPVIVETSWEGRLIVDGKE